jgi:hypothetical protein
MQTEGETVKNAGQNCGTERLELPAAEEVVFFAAGAIGAAQAGDKKQRDAHRHNNGEDTSVRSYPMNQALHSWVCIDLDSETARWVV